MKINQDDLCNWVYYGFIPYGHYLLWKNKETGAIIKLNSAGFIKTIYSDDLLSEHLDEDLDVCDEFIYLA